MSHVAIETVKQCERNLMFNTIHSMWSEFLQPTINYPDRLCKHRLQYGGKEYSMSGPQIVV